MAKHKIIKSLLPLAINIDSVQSDPRNARLHPARNLEAIKLSLETYGQRKPIVVNNGIIEAGNGLWESAKALGWKKIAAVQVEDDATMASGYAIMDNQSALLAEWDFPVLKDILVELDTGAIDMDITGFTAADIEEMIGQNQPIAPEENKPSEIVEVKPRLGHLILVYTDESEREIWLQRLGLDYLSPNKKKLTVSDVRNRHEYKPDQAMAGE